MKVVESLVISMLVVGCGSEEDAASTENHGSTTDAPSEDASSGGEDFTSDPTTASATGTSSGMTDAIEPFVPVPARAIRPVALEGNQGVGIEIASDGEPVVSTSPLLNNRRTLFRAEWAVEDGWIARDIEARLVLTDPDGAESVYRHVLWIDGPPGPAALDPRLEWIVEPQDLVEGLEYSVSLWEVEPGFETLPEPSAAPSLPSEGRALLPVLGGELRLEVVLVPMDYDAPGCSTSIELTDENLTQLFDTARMWLPINALDVSVHAPMTVLGPLDTGVELLQRLSSLRTAENPTPNVLYMGAIDTCGDLPLGGLSWRGSLPPSLDEADLRASFVHWEAQDLGYTAYSMVHEMGHALGRRHVRCSGTEDDVDFDYPLDGGALGERAGWGVVDLGFRDPEIHADYMSYCQPSWISAYGWNTFVPVFTTFAQWASADVVPDAVPMALMGVRMPGGSVKQWTATRVRLPDSDLRADEAVEFVSEAGERTSGEVYVRAVADGDGELVVVQLPESDPSPHRLVHRSGGRERVHVLED